MKVLIILRSSYSGHSIELVYRRICDQLNISGIKASIYTLKSNSFFPLRDIIKLNKTDADIYHISGDVNFIATFLLKKNIILTIHDIGRYLVLSGLKKILYKWYWITLPIFFSKYIFSSSEQTQKRIKMHLSFNQKKILHVPICSGLDIKTTIKKDSKAFKILHIGTSENKNLTNVIKSIANINCTLIIVGKILPKDNDLLEKHNIDFQNYINASNKKMISLYQDANLLTFPSFHEGFGLPIIEAQMAGTPVITSKISPMIEVSGNAALLVDPNLVSDIRNGILKIIDSPALQNKMIEDGLKNTERYSVKIVTVRHIELYRKTLEKFS